MLISLAVLLNKCFTLKLQKYVACGCVNATWFWQLTCTYYVVGIPRGKLPLLKVLTPSLLCLEELLNKVVFLFWIVFFLASETVALGFKKKLHLYWTSSLLSRIWQALWKSVWVVEEAVICIMRLCMLADKREVLFNSQFTCWSDSESGVLQVWQAGGGSGRWASVCHVTRDRAQEMAQVLPEEVYL